MQRAAILFHIVDRAAERLVHKEIAVLDRLCDARQFLIHDTPRADV